MSLGAGTSAKRTSCPGLRLLGGEHWAERLDDGLGLILFGANLDDDAGERVAAADLHRLGLGVLGGVEIDVAVVLVRRALVDHGEVGGERRGAGAAVGAIGCGLQKRAGHLRPALRHVGIGEVLCRLVDQRVDLVGLELDPVILGEHALVEVGDADAHRLRRIGCGAVAVGADRRLVGVELEGIEGGKGVGVVRRGSGKSGYDAKVRLDGDVFA